jgi:hypothetical protein
VFIAYVWLAPRCCCGVAAMLLLAYLLTFLARVAGRLGRERFLEAVDKAKEGCAEGWWWL